MKVARFSAVLAVLLLPAAAGARSGPVVEERSIADLQAAMADGASSVAITAAFLARIAAMNRAGPRLRAVITTNPDALAQARASDARRRAGRRLGPLDGVPVLIKDNIETADPMPTTAGSLALKDNVTRRDAPVVANLRRAGAVILGKTNLSEWANIRSSASMSGWSAIGGLVRNPYALDRTACGSSSGSGAAVAASFAAAGVGTETDGSVVCPSAMNGLVGLKPTIGVVSAERVVPISHSQDTPGPMARSVTDAAILLSAMVGGTADYAAPLSRAHLRGVRVAVLRPAMPAALRTRYEAQLLVLKSVGAVLVDIEQPKLEGLGEAEFEVLKTELKADMDAYLAATPPAVTARTLDQVIAFNTAHAEAEMPFFAQETFEAAARTGGLADAEYLGNRAKSLRLAGAEGIDAMLRTADATILVEPTQGLPWLSDSVSGDNGDGPNASRLPAVAGYPHLTVPMGLVKGLPVGLSFIATRGSDQAVLDAGYVYEQASRARVAPLYLPAADVGPGMEGMR